MTAHKSEAIMAQINHTVDGDHWEETETIGITPFGKTLLQKNIQLTRDNIHTLQVNVGLICNQTCRHCHLNAGPGKKEVMTTETAAMVAEYAGRCGFQTIDITGGAPELNPDIIPIARTLYSKAPNRLFRSNLSALNDGNHEDLITLLLSFNTAIVASFPSLNENQADSQRGDGIFKTSIDALKMLNEKGYGQEGSGLQLNLVSNPTGAFLAPTQDQTEKRFKKVLKEKWGIVFNNLFNFSNAPLGRFRKWLEQSGNLEGYIKKLADGFNPSAVEGVMCRTLVTVSWDGFLYDCDFNLARGLFMGNRKTHVSEITIPPETGSPIMTADHCYTCTAGSGFT